MKNRGKRILLPILMANLLISFVLLPGCGRTDPAAGKPAAGKPAVLSATQGVSVTDLAGRAVKLSHPPQRFVSLAPSNTEILFALGAGDKVVGVTNFCDWPPGALQKTRIGDLGRPDLEKILSLAPDCVLVSNKTSQEIIGFMSDNNIPVIVSEAASFDDIGKSIYLIGMLSGKAEEAGGLVDRMAERLRLLDDKLTGAARVRCYYAVSFGDYGNWTAGPGSFLHDVIRRAGGENLGAVVGKPWAEISLETLVTLDPDVILVGQYSGPDVSQLRRLPGYQDLSAVKNNRIIILDDNLLGRPGPRIVDGVYMLAQKLHPEYF